MEVEIRHIIWVSENCRYLKIDNLSNSQTIQKYDKNYLYALPLSV